MPVAAAVAAAASGYDDNDRRASSRVIRLAAGGDVWRWWTGPAGTPVCLSCASRRPSTLPAGYDGLLPGASCCCRVSDERKANPGD